MFVFIVSVTYASGDAIITTTQTVFDHMVLASAYARSKQGPNRIVRIVKRQVHKELPDDGNPGLSLAR